MSENLAAQRCVACHRDAPRVTDEELREAKVSLPDWQIIDIDTIPRLRRTFTVTNFATALELTNRIGALAEAEGHHPAIFTEWGRVTVDWWTHKIRGLHKNDLIMAAKTDELAAS